MPELVFRRAPIAVREQWEMRDVTGLFQRLRTLEQIRAADREKIVMQQQFRRQIRPVAAAIAEAEIDVTPANHLQLPGCPDTDIDTGKAYAEIAEPRHQPIRGPVGKHTDR